MDYTLVFSRLWVCDFWCLGGRNVRFGFTELVQEYAICTSFDEFGVVQGKGVFGFEISYFGWRHGALGSWQMCFG